MAFRLSGFRAVRITSFWRPGLDEAERRRAPHPPERRRRGGAERRSRLRDGHEPRLATTPLTDEAQGDFASYAAAIVREVPSIEHVIVGNEPNLNRFWLPQFGLDGTSAAPAAYLALLAEPTTPSRPCRPAACLRRRCLPPRKATGRTAPPDPLADDVHPGARSRVSRERPRSSGDGRVRDPPVRRQLEHAADHGAPRTTTIGVADYDKLVGLLGAAFDGTAQPGSQLPILYGEYGVETHIPASKESLYTGSEPDHATRDRGDAGRVLPAGAVACLLPAQRDRRADLPVTRRAGTTSLAVGRPLRGRHAQDEPSTRHRVARPHDRRIDRALPRRRAHGATTDLRFGTRQAAKRGIFRVSFRCDLDCGYQVRLENAATHSTKLVRRGRAEVGELVQSDLRPRRLRPGAYRYTIRLDHPVNPAPPTLRRGPVFRLP